jgi:CheY-like chemotaxis protein
MLSRLLSRTHAGWTIAIAATYAEAIEAAKKHHFDFLICDIWLPDGDGCELLLQLRAIYPILAIAATGLAMPDDISRYRESGFDDFVIKPYTMEAILNSIDRITEATHKNGGIDPTASAGERII